MNYELKSSAPTGVDCWKMFIISHTGNDVYNEFIEAIRFHKMKYEFNLSNELHYKLVFGFLKDSNINETGWIIVDNDVKDCFLTAIRLLKEYSKRK